MIKHIKKMKETVKGMLFYVPKTRDNDFLLMVKIWAEQNPQLRNKDYSFTQFAADFIEGKYAHPETIRRNRPMLQNEFPELRGKKYYKRKKIGEQGRIEINN